MPFAYIANLGDDNISVVDTATDTIGATITLSLGNAVSGIAVTQDGATVYALGGGTDTITVIDAATNTITKTLNMSSTVTPLGIAVTPDGSKLYITNSGTDDVYVVDTSPLAVVATIGCGGISLGVAVSPKGDKAYVAVEGSQHIAVVSTSTNSITSTISTSPGGPSGVAFTPDGSKAYVSMFNASRIVVIDAINDTVTTSFPMPSIGWGVAIRADGKRAYVVDSSDSLVTVIDTASDTISATIAVGSNLGGAASATPDNSKIYVTNPGANNVSVISTASNNILATIAVGRDPQSFGIFIQQGVSPMTSTYAAPQGRLTLTSGTPVMTADVTGTSAEKVYYDPYVGNIIPIYDGANMQSYPFSELTMALDMSNHLSGKIYDLFAAIISSVVAIGAGPAWTNGTTRSAAIQQTDGLWVNSASITLTNGSGSGTSVLAGEATYLGSVYMTANGQTGVQFKPAAAAGGSDNVVGIWNAYNRVHIDSLCSDSSTSWTYGTATWRKLDNNTKNRVTYLDGLGQSFVKGRVATIAYNATAGDGCEIGVVQNATTGAPSKPAYYQGGSSGSAVGAPTFSAEENFPPVLGLNYLQGMENSPNATTVTFGFNGGSTSLLFEGEF